MISEEGVEGFEMCWTVNGTERVEAENRLLRIWRRSKKSITRSFGSDKVRMDVLPGDECRPSRD